MSFSGLPNQISAETIANNGFMPALAVADFQRRYQAPAEALEPLMLEQLTMAVIEVNEQLVDWQAAHVAEGVEALADIEADQVGDRSTLVWLYERAVFALAKAWMISPSAAIGRRDTADQSVTDSQRYYETLLVSSEQAVRQILGRTRVTVALL